MDLSGLNRGICENACVNFYLLNPSVSGEVGRIQRKVYTRPEKLAEGQTQAHKELLGTL